MWLKNQIKCSPCSQGSTISKLINCFLLTFQMLKLTVYMPSYVLITGQQEHITKKKWDCHCMLEFHKFHLLYQWDKLNWYFHIETSDNTWNTQFHLNIQHENYLESGWQLLGLWMEGNFMYILTVLPYFRQWLVLGCSTCTCSIVVLFTFR